MKVGILTFPKSASFGASLQMVALYKALELLGCDVEAINYWNDYMRLEKHVHSYTGSIKNDVKRVLRKIIYHKGIRRFRNFENSIKLYPSKYISTEKELKILSSRYDVMVCGSDQVWNPDITGSDYNYFFKFCDDNNKKYSYAPSFGVDELSEKDAKEIAPLLKQFKGLSVREKQGAELINRLTGQAAHVVLDPTLLLDKTEWQSMQKPVSCKCKNYILYFTVVGSKTLNEFAQDLSKKTGCEIVYVGGRFLDSLFSKNNIMKNIGPEEWLYLVSNARYVVTNSFHGTAFSINLEKEFFVELSSFTNTRLINIVDMFELNDRVIINGKNINIDKKIDYVSVKYKLEIEQKQSFDYLKTMIDTIAAKT